jgi:hypothetical protein
MSEVRENTGLEFGGIATEGLARTRERRTIIRPASTVVENKREHKRKAPRPKKVHINSPRPSTTEFKLSPQAETALDATAEMSSTGLRKRVRVSAGEEANSKAAAATAGKEKSSDTEERSVLEAAVGYGIWEELTGDRETRLSDLRAIASWDKEPIAVYDILMPEYPNEGLPCRLSIESNGSALCAFTYDNLRTRSL